ncbi:MAG: lysophospholipid acyltransferase family protein [Verrucomicrobiota bacterium JB022]|nr:lysophospholipid acyltransferase family protein [Verrucomicrobiota bacterium JB022]
MVPERSETPVLADLPAELPSPFLRSLYRWTQPLTEPLLCMQRLNRHYARASQNPEELNGFDRALQELNIRPQVRAADLERIPATGPVMIVANHPYGAVDGLVMGSVLLRRRPDARLLVNYLLNRVEFLRPWLFMVDPFGGQGAQQRNLSGIKNSHRHLSKGGLLATWPSGTVSHWHWDRRQVTDPRWASNLASLILRTKATVVPAYFPGGNSLAFQLAGMVHPMARTAMLVREFMSKCGEDIEVRFGQPISAARLSKFTDEQELMDFLRLKTYILRNRQVADRTSFRRARPNKRDKVVPVPEGPSREALQAEVAALPAEQLLVEQGDFAIYYAQAQQVPLMIDEIGRLRELTFREVGEGTNGPRDLDRFDQDYLHLFLWNRSAGEMVGAYRLGLTDKILPRQGAAGIYTTTLFRYQPGVLEGFGPAIELGRSFVRAEYQRRPQSLALLWKGIGAYIARHPQYKLLFGPVSISKEYQSLSKNMMVMYLKEHSLDPDLAHKVRAKNPPRSRHFGRLDRNSFASIVRDIDDVSGLISEIEHEERGVPVLLRQYLKFNATVLSFNVDPDFNNCIDSLILTDLTKTNERVLKHYLGEEGCERFYAYHEVRRTEKAEVSQE